MDTDVGFAYPLFLWIKHDPMEVTLESVEEFPGPFGLGEQAWYVVAKFFVGDTLVSLSEWHHAESSQEPSQTYKEMAASKRGDKVKILRKRLLWGRWLIKEWYCWR